MNVNYQLENAKLRLQWEHMLSEFPELMDDEALHVDVLEGQTDALGLLEKLTSNVRKAQTMQAAIKQRIEDIKARQYRYEAREQFFRKMAHLIMQSVDLRRIEFAEATLSLRAGPPKVIITNEEAIPEAYWRVKREPKLSELREALKNGESVPGCVLSNGAETLAMRTK